MDIFSVEVSGKNFIAVTKALGKALLNKPKREVEVGRVEPLWICLRASRKQLEAKNNCTPKREVRLVWAESNQP